MSDFEISGTVMGADALSRKLREWKEISGKEWPTVLRVEARNVAASFARSTQPYGEGESAREKGVAAVGRDVRMVYGSASDAWSSINEKDPQLAAVFWYFVELPNQKRASQILASSTALVRNVPFETFDSGAAHKAARNRRGRVSRRVPAMIVRTYGRVESYIKMRQALVGFAKSAWATVARALGSAAMLPAWIKRNRAPGSVVDRSGDAKNPRITIQSDVDYADRVLRPDQIGRALSAAEGRLRKMCEVALSKSRAKARL